MARICIDPGHGLLRVKPRLFDPGAVHPPYREADIVLDYAHRLRLACLSAGHEVVMTRQADEDVAPLLGRVRHARAQRSDMLISLHTNAAVSREAHGIETLFKVSKDFATDLQRASVESIGLRDRGLKPRPLLAVLQFPGPCALIELGFITNDDDRAVMLSPRTQDRFAAAIVAALDQGGWT